MKYIYLFAIVFGLSLVGCKTGVGITYKHYGPNNVDTSNAISLDQMVLDFKNQPQKAEFIFKAPLTGVCQSAGCWVSVQPSSGESIRVRFKDHFLIPPATELNSIAYFHGRAYFDTLSVDLQKHFLEDAKASQAEIDQIVAPKIELNFEADGVWVKKSTASKSNK